MQLRLIATRAEMAAALPVLRAVLDIDTESRRYPGRGVPDTERVYLTVHGVSLCECNGGMPCACPDCAHPDRWHAQQNGDSS